MTLLMLFQDLLCPLPTSSYGWVMSSPFQKANQRHSQLRQSRILRLWLESDPSLKKHPCTEYQNNGSSAKEGKLLWIARNTFLYLGDSVMGKGMRLVKVMTWVSVKNIDMFIHGNSNSIMNDNCQTTEKIYTCFQDICAVHSKQIWNIIRILPR